MELNEFLLEGKADEDEEEEIKEEDGKKPDESKAGGTKKKPEDDDDTLSESANNYLEQFKILYRANMISTGTISIVVSVKNPEELVEYPNPCAESYGAIIIDEDSIVNEDFGNADNPKSLIKRNETILPGILLRQNTNTSKGLVRKPKQKTLMNKKYNEA